MEKEKGILLKVECKRGHVEYEVSWKHVKNTMRLCDYCPVKHSCKHRSKEKIKVFDLLREDIGVHTFNEVIV